MSPVKGYPINKGFKISLDLVNLDWSCVVCWYECSNGKCLISKVWWEAVQQWNTALFTKCSDIHIYITISTLLHHSIYNKIVTRKILAVHTQKSSIHYPKVPKEYTAVHNSSTLSLKNHFDQSYKLMNNFTAFKIRALTHSCITNSTAALQIILWGFLFNWNSRN